MADQKTYKATDVVKRLLDYKTKSCTMKKTEIFENIQQFTTHKTH